MNAHDAYTVPYAAGIPGRLRLIYVPLPRPVKVRHLEVGGAYRAQCFDPARGTLSPLGVVRPDREGAWRSPPPPAPVQDWTLVLAAR